MAVKPDHLKIVQYPAVILRAKAGDVPGITDEVCAVATRMLELMHQAEGVGLAAPQVGLSWRMFVTNPTGDPQDDAVFINPVLSDPASQIEAREEGCLSIPEVRGEIRRPRSITIRATNLEGQTLLLTSSDLEARIWQHENDHLDGILIIDRMSPIDKLANRRRLKQLEDH